MKKVYFVQANISCTDVRSYLPYAAGCLIAYAEEREEIRREYEFPEIFFRREKPEKVVAALDAPYMVAFSCNTWNMEYNKRVARAVKQTYPDCLILFGGHNITQTDALLKQLAFVDYMIFGEGEEPFYHLLRALMNAEAFDEVPNLIYRDGSKTLVNHGIYDFDIEAYPSPYLTGVFDKLLAGHPDIEFNVTMETNRGCPFGCDYCDWSPSRRVRLFSMDRVKGEIDWLSEHKIAYCMPGDANFGISDRDVEIARYVIEKREESGYPEIFKPCYSKSNAENVFKAGVILNSCGADKGVTVSCQSLSPEVLKNIGRINITEEEFRETVRRFDRVNIPTYTELIIGLPGETLDSFREGLCKTIEYGQNNSMTVYMCYLFPGSPMYESGYRKKYGIKTETIPINTGHYRPDFNGIPEYYEVIVGTDTMPFEDWVECNIFAAEVQCFHHLGLLSCFSIYLRREKNIPYYDFYTRLSEYIKQNPDTRMGSFFHSASQRLRDTKTADWTYHNDVFSEIGWFFEEGAFLEFVYAGEAFWQEAERFLREFELPPEVFRELLHYQKSILRTPGERTKTICSAYDFYTYFSPGSTAPLVKRKNRLEIECQRDIRDWKDYAIRIVWYGKRHNATLITNSYEKVRQIYEDGGI